MILREESDGRLGTCSLPLKFLMRAILGTGSALMAERVVGRMTTQQIILADLARMTATEIHKRFDLPMNRANALWGAFEIARRVVPRDTADRISCPRDIVIRYRPVLQDQPEEHMIVLLLNNAGVVTRNIPVGRGTISACLADPREVFREAILDRSSAIILMHNHPSNVPTPSTDDRKITQQLVEAGKLLEIPVRDHVIICGDTYVSFAEQGWL